MTMRLFGKKTNVADRPPILPAARPTAPGTAKTSPVKNDSVLKVDLPDMFAFQQDQTRAPGSGKKPAAAPDGVSPQCRGTILLVETDDEVCRLISRLLQHEGYNVVKAVCLAEAREMVREVAVDYLLARRASVPLNLQTEIALRDLGAQTTVRIVDDFPELFLGQVVDYQAMSECYLGLVGLLLSLVEGANLGARGHAHNVAKYCRLVGQRLGMKRRDLDALTLAACVHDLGSLETNKQIGEIILNQREMMPPSLRPTLELLANVPFPYPVNELLAAATERQAPAAGPDGAEPTDLPLGSRILRVVDTYDTIRRSDSRPGDEEAVFDWLRQQPSGTFDTDVLETLIHLRKHERAINAMNIFWAAVLLVDPHPEEVQLLRLRLENDDCHVLVAKTIEEALHCLRHDNVTLVVTEYRLGGDTSGFDLLRTIKNDAAMRSIPVVLHAPAQTDLIRQALELGAEDWYPKPYNVEITAMKLSRILSRAQANPMEAGEGVHGNLRDMGLIEMVQIFSAGGRSVQILLENGPYVGELVMQNGQITSATAGDLIGGPAAVEILGWHDGYFRILPLKKAPPVTVLVSTDNLLLQSCLKQDQDRQTRASATGSESMER